jgi:hypothetical protein
VPTTLKNDGCFFEYIVSVDDAIRWILKNELYSFVNAYLYN